MQQQQEEEYQQGMCLEHLILMMTEQQRAFSPQRDAGRTRTAAADVETSSVALQVVNPHLQSFM